MADGDAKKKFDKHLQRKANIKESENISKGESMKTKLAAIFK